MHIAGYGPLCYPGKRYIVYWVRAYNDVCEWESHQKMVENRNPLISVVMAAYNAEAYIGEAISSAMKQTFSNWELIVVDDCSFDRTVEIVNQFAQKDSRIKVYQNAQNMGVAMTRNAGIEKCRGSYVAFLDSDDVWKPNKLERQIKLLQETGASIVYCSYAIIDANGNPAKADYIVPAKVDFESVLRENSMACSAMMIRREVFEQISFNAEYYHEDFVLGLDMLKAGYKAVGCTDVLMEWRYIVNSRSYNKRKSAGNRWKVYRDYLKLPLLKSVWLMGQYALAGFRKYR